MPRASSKSVTTATKPQEEKITINLGCVDLGQIDLLVQEGFYANRTDVIRTAIRNQLAVHGDAVRQAAARKTLSLGVLHLGKAELQALKAAGKKIDVRVLGLATIAHDVTPELALATISSLTVLGALHASPAVKAALAGRSH
jgi:Arc/MetJ-type ribon-helix-helix transcriptional regulator